MKRRFSLAPVSSFCSDWRLAWIVCRPWWNLKAELRIRQSYRYKLGLSGLEACQKYWLRLWRSGASICDSHLAYTLKRRRNLPSRLSLQLPGQTPVDHYYIKCQCSTLSEWHLQIGSLAWPPLRFWSSRAWHELLNPLAQQLYCLRGLSHQCWALMAWSAQFIRTEFCSHAR